MMRMVVLPVAMASGTILTAGGVLGSSPIAIATSTHQAVARGLTNQDVVALVKAGFSDDLVISRIDAAEKRDFDLSSEGLVSLKAAGLSERVIAAMLGDRASSSKTAVSGSGPVAATDASRSLHLSEGTEIRVRTKKPLVSNVAKVGDVVELSLSDDVVVAGTIIVQRGSMVLGAVTQATPQLLTRAGKLEVAVKSLRTASGLEIPLRGAKSVSGGRGLIRGDEATLPADAVFVATVAGNHSIPATYQAGERGRQPAGPESVAVGQTAVAAAAEESRVARDTAPPAASTPVGAAPSPSNRTTNLKNGEPAVIRTSLEPGSVIVKVRDLLESTNLRTEVAGETVKTDWGSPDKCPGFTAAQCQTRVDVQVRPGADGLTTVSVWVVERRRNRGNNNWGERGSIAGRTEKLAAELEPLLNGR
jgi:hypothetical protein